MRFVKMVVKEMLCNTNACIYTLKILLFYDGENIHIYIS